LYTVKPRQPGAMQLRTRGHDFELSIIKYEFNKRIFIVQSLFNYVWFLCFIVLSSFCILLHTCANVICIKFFVTYLQRYAHGGTDRSARPLYIKWSVRRSNDNQRFWCERSTKKFLSRIKWREIIYTEQSSCSRDWTTATAVAEYKICLQTQPHKAAVRPSAGCSSKVNWRNLIVGSRGGTCPSAP